MYKNLKLLFISILFISCASRVVTISEIKDRSDISLRKVDNKAEITNSEIVYFLPKTDLLINFEITKTIDEVGYFKRYSKTLLGINAKISKSSIKYKVSKISIKEINSADETNIYLVKSLIDSIQLLINVNKLGILESINGENKIADNSFKTTEIFLDSKIKKNIKLISYNTIPPFKAMMKIPSISNKAVYAANVIYKIREKKFDLLTREAEDLPQDGGSYKQIIDELNKLETSYKLLFSGVSKSYTTKHEFKFSPSSTNLEKTLFYFNPKRGILSFGKNKDSKPCVVSVTNSVINDTISGVNYKSIKNGIVYKQSFSNLVDIKIGKKRIGKTRIIFPQLNKTSVIPYINGDDVEIKFNTKKGNLISIEKK